MSFFRAQCPECDAIYWTGVVGTTLMGVHICPVTQLDSDNPAGIVTTEDGDGTD